MECIKLEDIVAENLDRIFFSSCYKKFEDLLKREILKKKIATTKERDELFITKMGPGDVGKNSPPPYLAKDP